MKPALDNAGRTAESRGTEQTHDCTRRNSKFRFPCLLVCHVRLPALSQAVQGRQRDRALELSRVVLPRNLPQIVTLAELATGNHRQAKGLLLDLRFLRRTFVGRSPHSLSPSLQCAPVRSSRVLPSLPRTCPRRNRSLPLSRQAFSQLAPKGADERLDRRCLPDGEEAWAGGRHCAIRRYCGKEPRG